MNSIKKYLLYKKMMRSDLAFSDIKREVKGRDFINIKWTFVDTRTVYEVSAYIISVVKYDPSYTVNVFKNGKNVALFAGPGKARKLITRAIDSMGAKSR